MKKPTKAPAKRKPAPKPKPKKTKQQWAKVIKTAESMLKSAGIKL
jgi:hypothetical protein